MRPVYDAARGSATRVGVLLIDWPDSEMYTELLEA